MKTAIALLASTYLLVLFLGLQSLNVNGGHRRAAFLTSFGIGLANLVLYKLAPDASGLEIAAYLLGGPAGILTAMTLHPRLVSIYRKPHAGRADADTTRMTRRHWKRCDSATEHNASFSREPKRSFGESAGSDS